MKLRFLTLLTCILLGACHLQGQSNDGTPYVKGYDITLTGLSAEDAGQQFYLYGYNGSEIQCIDSAIAKGKIRFKNKKKIIPQGIYTISSSNGCYDLDCLGKGRRFDFILHLSNRLVITIPNSDADFGSCCADDKENQIFISYALQKGKARDAKQAREVYEKFVTTSPDAFVSRYLRATYELFGKPILDEQSYNKYLDAIDFTDPKLLHVPPYYLSTLYTYILQPESQNADDCIAKIKTLLSRCSNPVVRNYHIKALFSQLDVHNPDYDPVLVYLYDNYDHSWIDEGDERRYKRKIDYLRKIIPGAEIPELISHDIDGKAHSTLDIKKHYTILWFWDPDCDHCQEVTPLLHKFYQEDAEKYSFEVFAVEVNDDYERWKAFSDKHQLWDWTNLSTSRGEANLDFIEYFDIMTTPVMFLVDNTRNHTIIARQITLEELRSFFNQQ